MKQIVMLAGSLIVCTAAAVGGMVANHAGSMNSPKVLVIEISSKQCRSSPFLRNRIHQAKCKYSRQVRFIAIDAGKRAARSSLRTVGYGGTPVYMVFDENRRLIAYLQGERQIAQNLESEIRMSVDPEFRALRKLRLHAL